MLLLLKLRPGFFTPEEQQRHQEITGEIKKTALIVIGGFITTSAHRVWAIKQGNKSIAQGVGVILLSYMPGFMFYSYHNKIQMQFVRQMSLKYQQQVSDLELKEFIES